MTRRPGRPIAILLALASGLAAAETADLPRIVHVAVPEHLTAERPVEVRVTFRAPRANVVALVQVVEDLDGPRRATSQREVNVLARAFGEESGELVVPVTFPTAGRKRLVLWLVTDERQAGDPETVEVDVGP